MKPERGLPKVDREYYVVQSDFYAEDAFGEAGLQAYSRAKMLAEQPEYFVFNGSVGALTGGSALRAQVGETVRIYFGVGGPNKISSFHVIGEIFDTVYPEAASQSAQNVRTTFVPPSGATIVDFKVEVARHVSAGRSRHRPGRQGRSRPTDLRGPRCAGGLPEVR